jgi:hypothetical protein
MMRAANDVAYAPLWRLSGERTPFGSSPERGREDGPVASRHGGS